MLAAAWLPLMRAYAIARFIDADIFAAAAPPHYDADAAMLRLFSPPDCRYFLKIILAPASLPRCRAMPMLIAACRCAIIYAAAAADVASFRHALLLLPFRCAFAADAR